MLDTSPANLYQLVGEAEKHRQAKLEKEVERIDRRLGPGYVRTSTNADQAINHQHEWLSLMLPRMVFRAPKFNVRSARPKAQQDTATAVRLFLNRWAKTVKLDRLLLPLAVDYAMFWGVAMVTPDRGHGVPNRRVNEDWIPRVTRITPARFIMDPHCDGPDTARFLGHVWVDDIEALIEKARADEDGGWKVAELEKMRGKDTGLHKLGNRFKRTVPRNEIVGYDIWVPEKVTDGMEPEDGFNGTIFTMIEGEAGFVEIRKPRAFWGPPWGPYTLFGCYPANDDPWPLSPLAASEHSEIELNKQLQGLNESAAQYKRVIVGPKDDATHKAFHGQYIGIETLDPSVQPREIEIGGVTDQQIKNVAALSQNLERVSGMDAVQAGNVSGDGTATEVAIADSVTQTRAGFVIEQFAYGVERVARTAAWYAVKDDRVRLSLGQEAAEALGVVDPVFLGGEIPGEDAPFDALELEIDPMSMARMTEGVHQRRAMEFFRVLTEMTEVAKQAPYLNIQKAIARAGDVLNIPDAEEFIDLDLFMQVAGGGMAGPGAGGVGGPPMMAGAGPELVGRETGAMAGAAMRV